MKEAWCPVAVEGEDWPYEVSDRGHVRRRPGTEFGRPTFGATLRLHSGGKYQIVTLSRNGERRTCPVHRMVLEAFVGHPPKDHEANHRDGNKSNNALGNLEWITPEENRKHATLHGLASTYITSAEHTRRRWAYSKARNDTESARLLGLSKGTFNSWRRRIGLPPKHPRAKLSASDIAEIRERYRAGEIQVRLAEEFGVTQTCISHVVRGRRR